jgi:hypothetical protein
MIEGMHKIGFLCLSLLLLSVLPLAGQTMPACEFAQQYGTIEAQPQNNPYILAAPHGIFDTNTDLITRQLCQDLGWNCLIARGQRRNQQPINVNRPTEGVRLSSEQEKHTERAKQVFECYLSQAQALKNHDFKLYIELHGNARKESKHQIEIASWGISNAQSQTIKAILNQALREAGLSPHLKIAMQGLDSIHFRHGGAKKWGVFNTMQPVLALELPAWVRKEPQARQTLLKALKQAFLELQKRQLP